MAAKTKFKLKRSERDSYLELVMTFPLASIQSESHLAAAQDVIDRLLAQRTLDDGQMLYLDALSDLVAAFEDAHHAIGPASDAEMLRHLMEAKEVTQIELHRATGLARSSLSEVLAGKKPFSRSMMRKLAEFFQVDIGVLAANV